MLKALLNFILIIKCCDYCEVLCEILIFGNHISVIFYFLDGVQGSFVAMYKGPRTKTQSLFLETCHKAVVLLSSSSSLSALPKKNNSLFPSN